MHVQLFEYHIIIFIGSARVVFVRVCVLCVRVCVHLSHYFYIIMLLLLPFMARSTVFGLILPNIDLVVSSVACVCMLKVMKKKQKKKKLH